MDTSNVTLIVLIAVIFLVIGGVLAMALTRFQRSRRLKERFGPEYERAISQAGDKREAENELEARLDHVKELDIRPLSAQEIDRFSNEWKATQAEFVDEPHTAIQKADRLIQEVMKARGYPVEDFEQRAADISVDYPDLVNDYRGMHLIAVKDEEDEVGTEEMRQAMVHGRALFEDLVQPGTKVEEANQKEAV